MPSKPIMIGALEFASRGDAYAFLKGILARYDVGDKVNAVDSAVLIDAIALHPNSSSKINGGIESFSVRTADFGTKCFWVNRVNGSTEKFALRACVYGEK
jgi:hypothetical protein